MGVHDMAMQHDVVVQDVAVQEVAMPGLGILKT
jgi:hypothetical protein